MSCRLAAVLVSLLMNALPRVSAETSIDRSLDRSAQLIVVRADRWSDDHGTLALYERTPDRSWRRVVADVPVTLGRNGLAWGIGLHQQAPTKREGDGRAPAGVFELERVHGGAGAKRLERFPYREMRAVMECVDDSQSRFYNRFIDAADVAEVKRGWTRTETIRAANPMFRWLLEVKHNWEQRPGYGSCIWLHIWKAPGVPTSGCTAMDAEAMERLVHWLDARKRPLLVQMPRAELRRLLPQLGAIR
jgi:zinc D-Ala-D-Ala dipeptidase